jgi:hypothetical protein
LGREPQHVARIDQPFISFHLMLRSVDRGKRGFAREHLSPERSGDHTPEL